MFNNPKERAILSGIASMMAKIVAADEHIVPEEIRGSELVFSRLGLDREKFDFCCGVFREALQDPRTVYDCAQEFAAAHPDMNVREIAYEILWDLACADSVVTPEEVEILRRICRDLGIVPARFARQLAKRGLQSVPPSAAEPAVQDQADGTPRGDSDASVNPYEVIGIAASASDEDVQAAYEAKARALQPSYLREIGLSDALICRARGRRSRLNDAWARIRSERGL